MVTITLTLFSASRCFASLPSLSAESPCPHTSFHHQGHRILPYALCPPSSKWRPPVSRRSGSRVNAAPSAEVSPAVIRGPGVVSSRSSGSKVNPANDFRINNGTTRTKQ